MATPAERCGETLYADQYFRNGYFVLSLPNYPSFSVHKGDTFTFLLVNIDEDLLPSNMKFNVSLWFGSGNVDRVLSQRLLSIEMMRVDTYLMWTLSEGYEFAGGNLLLLFRNEMRRSSDRRSRRLVDDILFLHGDKILSLLSCASVTILPNGRRVRFSILYLESFFL